MITTQSGPSSVKSQHCFGLDSVGISTQLRVAIQTTDPEIRDFLVEKQEEWAADSRTTTVETKKWFTYAVADFPRGLADFHGNKLDSGSVVNDEIEIQTGLKPVAERPL
ncbi:hypothetical protein FOQG_18928 [Fusarium oxysporum f. sp. raphani 54005]|uniref:Uncharacterized protein n=2 Tax=Fusarium oxysporum f. sp. raphani TaxID=96318 RepID=X0C0J7_FUSOX|nr:hypothetical protein FOQG_18928 [Fusarium oxysporum f. sp. raphani 54005]KAG7404553.1 hypothetical protein Forpi1262_v018553 [Fusarium oxysporum f. sp. raphani]